MTKFACCLAMTLILAASPPAWAEGGGNQPEAAPETAVAAPKKGGAYVLTEKDVAEYNVRDICELLSLLPRVSASTTGVTVQGSSSKTVAVIMDGRPLFNPASGKVYLNGIPIQSVKEVRLLQGPEAARHVGNTGGGVIVITSKKGKKQYVNSFSDETRNPLSGLDSQLDSRVFGEEARWSGPPWGIQRVSLAGNAEYREIDSNIYGQKEETVGGVSLCKEFQPARNVSILAGLKGIFYSDYDAEANPQLNVTWKPGPVRLSLLLERSNTMPTFDQRYYQSSTRLANPELSLETVYSAKIQFQHDWTSYFSWGLTPFIITIDDKIEYNRYAGLPKAHDNFGKAEYRNLASTRSAGVNVNAALRPCKSFLIGN